jgi:hypothetical protein
MKIIVLTDKSGKVAATFRPPEKKPGKDKPVFKFNALPDQTVHELDLPAEYGQIESADELHRRIGEHLKTTLRR